MAPALALSVRPAHRFVKVLGLCDPRRENVTIECNCGFVASGQTFAAAAGAFEDHKEKL